jgi:hypothetical protein
MTCDWKVFLEKIEVADMEIIITFRAKVAGTKESEMQGRYRVMKAWRWLSCRGRWLQFCICRPRTEKTSLLLATYS